LWVRQHGIMSLEDAHWRLSAYPAHAAGLRGRGALTVGLAADIIVYDPNTIDSLPIERLHDYPAGEWRIVQKAVGYEHILVNGEVTIDHGAETATASGHLLRHGSALTSTA